MAIILCDCDNKTGSRLDLKAIKSFFETRGQKVYIQNKPCEDGIERLIKDDDTIKSVVIGGCLNESHKAGFKDTLRKCGLDPFALVMVSLIGERSLDRALLLLDAAQERLKLFGGTKERNLKPKFIQLGSKMSRRQFLTIPKVQYDIVPSIETELCRSKSHQCRLCDKKCQRKAIVFDEERQAIIEKDKCTGCGVCINVCPAKAIVYPYFTKAEIIRELEVLLRRGDGINTDPCIILFACEFGGSMLDNFLSDGGELPEGFFPVIIPCLGMLDSFFFAYSFALGAVGIGLLLCPGGKCYKSAKLEDVRQEIALTDAILKTFNVEGERITFIYTDSLTGLQRELDILNKRLNKLQPVRLFTGEEIEADYVEYSLAALLGKVNKLSEQNLLIEDYASIPAGRVWLDNELSCTFCGVCEKHCPANALTLEKRENGTNELMFYYKDCIGCGECVDRCPERILNMKKVIDIEKFTKAQRTLLAKESAVLCCECRKPFLNQALLQKIKTGLSTPAAEILFKLCPDCRMKTISRSLERKNIIKAIGE